MPPEVRKQDAVDFLRSLERGSVDLVLAEPPHSTDAEYSGHLVQDWIRAARAALTIDGALVTFVGSYQRDVADYLNAVRFFGEVEILSYDWRHAHAEPPEHGWSFVRSHYQILYCHDIHTLRPDGEPLYSSMDGPWEALLERLVRLTTDEGALVVDPFAGWGRNLLAADRLGRRAIGCDVSDESLERCVENGCVRVD